MMPLVALGNGQVNPSQCGSLVAKGRIETAGSFHREKRLATVIQILKIRSRIFDMSKIGAFGLMILLRLDSRRFVCYFGMLIERLKDPGDLVLRIECWERNIYSHQTKCRVRHRSGPWTAAGARNVEHDNGAQADKGLALRTWSSTLFCAGDPLVMMECLTIVKCAREDAPRVEGEPGFLFSQG